MGDTLCEIARAAGHLVSGAGDDRRPFLAPPGWGAARKAKDGRYACRAAMEIKDKVAVITGAGSGIGQAVAVELARRRVRAMALVDLASASLDETAGLIRKPCGDKIRIERYIGDVTLCDFRREVFEDLTKNHRRGPHLRPGRRDHAGCVGREN